MVKMEAWETFLKHLEAELGTDTVLKWLRTLKITRFDACNLYLEAKDHFQALWFEEHIRPKVLIQLLNNNKKKIKVHLVVAAIPHNHPQDEKAPKLGKQNPPALQKFSLTFEALDESARLENFIIEPANELAVKLVGAISSQEPTEADFCNFNPIFIHGNQGSGKTHLLMAAAQEMQKNGKNVIYSTADTFTEHVVSAIRAGEMSHFRNAYRNIDVLIIDDVHIFSRRAATQEEFFHTFNTLHLSGKQIILASNCSPQELNSIEPRLVSRFEWGIALPIDPLSQQGLSQMIQMKAQTLNYKLPQKVIEFLIETFANTATITKALQALVLRAHLNEDRAPSSTLTPIRAKSLLSDLIALEEHLKLTPEKILQHVAEYFGILPNDMLTKSQAKDKVVPRQIAMFFCRQQLKIPYTKIGHFFNKDHSTVMSSIKLILKALETGDNAITDPIGTIGKKLRA